MNKFSRLFDGLLSKVTLFFVGLIIGGYYCSYLVDIVLFAMIFCVCVGQIYIELIDGKKEIKPSKIDSAILEKLTYTPVIDTTNALLVALSSLSPTLDNGKIVINDRVIHLAFTPNSLSANDIYSLVGSSKYSKHLILANGFTPDGLDFCSKWAGDVTTLSGTTAVEFFRKAGTLPSVSVLSGKEKRAKLLGLIIGKNRARGYFTCAFSVLILSAFTMRSIYFTLFASLAFALGIISLFSRKKA